MSSWVEWVSYWDFSKENISDKSLPVEMVSFHWGHEKRNFGDLDMGC